MDQKRKDQLIQRINDRFEKEEWFEECDEWKLIIVGSKYSNKVKIQVFKEE
jgi:hypothetical protein